MMTEQTKQTEEQAKPQRGHDVIQPDNGFIDIREIFGRIDKSIDRSKDDGQKRS